MKDNVKQISLGIRHRREFRIPEIAGSIMDYIMHDKESPFGEDFFQKTDPLLDNFENKGRMIIAEDGTSVVVDYDSVIINFPSESIEEGFLRITNEFIPFFKKIFKKFEIRNINRIGVVVECNDTHTETMSRIISEITDSNYSNTDHFALRFSQKEKDLKGLVIKDILDYANTIVTLAKTKDGVILKFDYQFYFSPEVGSINDIEFEKFLETANDRFEKKFLNWYKHNEE